MRFFLMLIGCINLLLCLTTMTLAGDFMPPSGYYPKEYPKEYPKGSMDGLPLGYYYLKGIMDGSTLAMLSSRPGCPDKCGNVTIPYPFGIGSNCSADASYTIICQNSSIPFLTNINLEVVFISLYGLIGVKQPVSPMACTDEQRTHSLVTSLKGRPFTISKRWNSLFVLGCQNAGWFRSKERSIIGGCMAICDANTTIQDACNGVNCCQISINEPILEPDFSYRSIVTSGKNVSFCGYAFLAAETWFQDNYKTYKGLQRDLLNPFDEEFRDASLVLAWKPYKTTISSYADCYVNDYFDDLDDNLTRPLRCVCDYGFEGNPYLPEGCQDIDECSDHRHKYCPGICTNTIGSFTCDEHHLSLKVKVPLIVVGSVLSTLLLIVVAWKSSKVVIHRIKANLKLKYFKRNGGLLLEKHELSANEKGIEKIKLFSSRDLAKATDRYNENRVLGRGGQGTVYKGMLTDGRIVAIKKSERIDEEDIETFINEVVILSQINHRNIVKLLGCCLESEVPLLVYEFVPNGTLFQHIHDPNEEFQLTWEMRVRIAIEVANCLSYLHSSASAPIYHRDIKSTNILLDEKYRARVSDFGTSRSVSMDKTHLTTKVLGTFGYLDPEYFQSSQFTEKSDVYSFGVVIIELLTGEKAVSTISRDVGEEFSNTFLALDGGRSIVRYP